MLTAVLRLPHSSINPALELSHEAHVRVFSRRAQKARVHVAVSVLVPVPGVEGLRGGSAARLRQVGVDFPDAGGAMEVRQLALREPPVLLSLHLLRRLGEELRLAELRHRLERVDEPHYLLPSHRHEVANAELEAPALLDGSDVARSLQLLDVVELGRGIFDDTLAGGDEGHFSEEVPAAELFHHLLVVNSLSTSHVNEEHGRADGALSNDAFTRLKHAQLHRFKTCAHAIRRHVREHFELPPASLEESRRGVRFALGKTDSHIAAGGSIHPEA
mmetsp:Transcript_34340/g.107652  ORF Transcript_34340/g.107652 Transcript_34340/m.107652 type:complete len:274 (+) Transcript_34340:593-1414(+)